MQHWNQRRRNIAVVIWPSFLAACLGTLLFFAKIDATRLPHAFVFAVDLSDQAIYSIGFMFFWLIALVATSMSTWLLRTERRMRDFPVLEENARDDLAARTTDQSDDLTDDPTDAEASRGKP